VTSPGLSSELYDRDYFLSEYCEGWERFRVDRGLSPRALLGDVIEHLTPDRAAAGLTELRRVLRPSGRLVVHTAPNRGFLTVGWRLARVALKLTGDVARGGGHHLTGGLGTGAAPAARAAGVWPLRLMFGNDLYAVGAA
jgi:hypothetical protein